MSPRAAWRLESIGFTQVYDYAAGKADWGSAGLPLEETRGSETRVGAHLRRDCPPARWTSGSPLFARASAPPGGIPASFSTTNGSCSAGSAAQHSQVKTTSASRRQ
jgi:hypothetical protein